jgi:exopolysaccharide biosynthesis polyprenyl glycosylphosphotransferase
MAYPVNRNKPIWRLTPSESRVILVVGDFVSSFLALFIALVLWSIDLDEWLSFSWQFIIERPPSWFYILPFLWIILLSGLYDHRRARKIKDTVGGILISLLLSVVLYLFVFFLSEPNSLPRLGVGLFLIGSTIFTLIWRMIYIRIFTGSTFMRRVLIVGAGNSGKTIVTIVKNSFPMPFHLIGLLDDDEAKQGTEFLGCPVLGSTKDLLKFVDEYCISNVIFAISGKMNSELVDSLLLAEENGIEVTTMPVIYEELLGRIPIYLLEQDWLLRVFIDQSHISRFYDISKRIFDIIGGLIGVLILLLILPFIVIGIFVDGGWPIFYQQIRLGKNGKEYKIIKFRSMNIDAEKDGKPRPAQENDERITKIGKFLRKSHLDELPQFINILKGEMSLVGPRSERPMIIYELQKKIPFYRARLLAKPGLTGWAQVNYGYASNVEENSVKLELDLYYIKHRSFLLDLSILIQTASSVIGLRGR